MTYIIGSPTQRCDRKPTLTGELEGRKRALVEAPEVVKLDALGVDARGKDEPLGVERGHRAARQVHETLAVGRPQIPEPDGFVQAAAEEGLVGGRHAERHDPLAVSAKVADVLVLRDVKVADDVVLLGAAVHDVRLVGREVDEVDAVLLGVERPPLGAPLTVVDDDLVVVGGGDEGGAVRREVQVVDRVLVLLEDLADPHGADHVVDELHLDDLGRWLRDHLLFLALRRRRGRFGAAACEHRRPGQKRRRRRREPTRRCQVRTSRLRRTCPRCWVVSTRRTRWRSPREKEVLYDGWVNRAEDSSEKTDQRNGWRMEGGQRAKTASDSELSRPRLPVLDNSPPPLSPSRLLKAQISCSLR